MKTLGLDISTSVTGLSVSDNGQIIFVDIIFLDDIKYYLDKFIYVEAYFYNFFQKWHNNIDMINIENYALQYQRTTIDTIVNLSSLNNFITFMCYKRSGICPNKLNVRSARKKVWGTTPKNVDSKLYVGEQVLKIYPNLIKEVDFLIRATYPQMICSRGENKGKLLKQYEMCWLDVADSITMSLYKE